MEGEKGFWQSKTVWGGIISLAAFAAGWLGYAITAADKAEVVDDITTLIGIAASLFAIYGRVSATKTIARG